MRLERRHCAAYLPPQQLRHTPTPSYHKLPQATTDLSDTSLVLPSDPSTAHPCTLAPYASGRRRAVCLAFAPHGRRGKVQALKATRTQQHTPGSGGTTGGEGVYVLQHVCVCCCCNNLRASAASPMLPPLATTRRSNSRATMSARCISSGRQPHSAACAKIQAMSARARRHACLVERVMAKVKTHSTTAKARHSSDMHSHARRHLDGAPTALHGRRKRAPPELCVLLPCCCCLACSSAAHARVPRLVTTSHIEGVGGVA